MNSEYRSPLDDLIDDQEETLPWAVTLADLMTLLLVFFILLYTVFFFQTREFERQLAGIQVTVDASQSSMSMLDYVRGLNTDKGKVLLEEVTGLLLRKTALIKEVEAAAKEQGWAQFLRVQQQNERVVLHLDGVVLFPAGSKRLSDRGLVVLYNLMDILERYPEYQLHLQERSRDRGSVAEGLAAAGQLSAARAGAMLQYLAEQGFAPTRMTATGYGNLLAPDLPDFAPERRVDIVLEKETAR